MGKLIRSILKLSFLAGLAYGGYRLYSWVRATFSEEPLPAPAFEPANSMTGAVETSDPYTIDESKLGGEVSQELLDILVCPEDKEPLNLVDGKWLVNPRNGNRYPIVEGIPVMLIEVGRKYRDPNLVTKSTESTPE